jgi:putative peptidoglycan lipid II flippase
VGANGLPADYQQVGTALSRLFLLQILFYGLTAIGSALLNARRRYVAAAWSPVLSNLVIIGSLWFVPRMVDGTQPLLADVLTNGGLRYTLGLGATAGIAVMALALVPALASAGVPMSFRFEWRHPVVAQLRRLSGFALGYVAANQLAIVVVQNLLVGVGEGTQDAYTKAFTWFVLPHGLLAVTIATTFAPEMTRAVQRRERQSLIDQASLGIRITALFTVPAGFGLFTLRRPIVGSAFQYGQFTADDGLLTSRALAGFALGLGAFSVYLFVLRVFYAHQDSRTPFVINVVENAVNIVLALVFVDRFGVLGLGAAFALAYAFAAGWSLQVLSYKVPGFSLRPIVASLWRIVLASLVMSEVVWLATKGVGANAGRGAVMRVCIGTAVGGAVYVAVLWLLGSDDIREVARRIRRRPVNAGSGVG